MHAAATIAILTAATLARAQSTLYAVDGARDTLITIDLSTAATRDVGPLGFDGGFWGLAFNPVPVPAPGGGFYPAGTLFGVERSTQRLYTLDTGTGHASPVGPLNTLGLWEALTFDTQGQLWTTDIHDRFRIDTATGHAAHVPGGFGAPAGLAYSLDTLPVAIAASGAAGGILPAGSIIGCAFNVFFAMDGTTWHPLLALNIPQAQEVVVAAPDGALYTIGGPLGDLSLWRLSLDPVSVTRVGSLNSGAIWGGAIIPAPGAALLLLLAAPRRARPAPAPHPPG